MSDEQIAYTIGQIKRFGLLDSADASNGRIGNMSDARWNAFYQDMVKAGAMPAGLDVRKAYDMRFLNQINP
jgi:NitT/TauT family transport system substrate-binding protein